MRLDRTPIGDHAAIGDCRSLALITRSGTLDWLCWPMFSSPALFAGLLDVEGGRFSLSALGPADYGREYLPGTNVLVTRVAGVDGGFSITDFMPVPGSGDELRPERELIRIVEGLSGAPGITSTFAPSGKFGRLSLRRRRWSATRWSFAAHGEVTYLHSSVAFSPSDEGDALTARFRLEAGQRVVFWLTHTVAQPAIFPDLARCDARLAETCSYWRDWLSRCSYQGAHREIVWRSLLALKLLTYAPSGAVVAAATTSLPESVGADRNWDYRYCWLRDSSLTFRVFNDTGYPEEAARYLRWLMLGTRLSAPRLKVVYDVYGRGNLDEIVLGDFHGWCGSSPVRVGNDAHKQFQLDLYGEAMAAAADFAEHGGRVSVQEAQLLRGWADTVAENWRHPDQGIWEVRTPPRHFTYSKAMAWVVFDALSRLIGRGHLPGGRKGVEALRRRRDEIADVIERQGVDPRGEGYVAAFGEDQVDASLLLLPWFGYADAKTPRMRATVARILRELGSGPLVRRYHTGFDGFSSREGAFMACGFWAVDCLARSGQSDEAAHRFDQLVGYGNDLGLMAEEMDVDTGLQLGNFPQAFSHVAVVNAAMTLSDIERRRSHGP